MLTLNRIAQERKLSMGIVFPIESYTGSVPKMQNQENLARLAEDVGFKSLWFRDVPLHDPSFGDSGQMYDPFVYMAHIMNQTKSIMLCTGSIILPLRHPIHTMKSIQSLQLLSGGRIIIGVASGDRPIEYPAFNQDLTKKNELFRDSFHYMKALAGDFPVHQSNSFGSITGNADLLPKAPATPFLVTGHSGQTMDWIAEFADGWIYYPRGSHILNINMEDWKASLAKVGCTWKPYMQSLYIDLEMDQKIEPSNIHLGFRCNIDFLKRYLEDIRTVGVNHVILNLKFNQLPIEQTLEIIGNKIIAKLEW